MKSGRLSDCLVINAICLLSAFPYVTRLGLYADDWGFMEVFTTSADQSLLGLYQSLMDANSTVRVRPMQVLIYAALYRVFGTHPLGFHVVNVGILLATATLFYLTLRLFVRQHLLAVGLPLLYALTPSYSTYRVWYTAIPMGLTSALYFLMLYCDIMTVRCYQSRAQHYWKILSMISVITALLSYEATLPLIIVSPLITWYAQYCTQRDWSWHGEYFGALIRSSIITLSVAAITMIFKIYINERGIFQIDMVSYAIRVISEYLSVFFGTYGALLPVVIYVILSKYLDIASLIVSIAVLFVSFALFSIASKDDTEDLASIKRSLIEIVIGLGLMLLCIGLYIALPDPLFRMTSATVANRSAAVPAIGVSLVMFAGIQILGTLARRLTGLTFLLPLMLSIYCSFGVLTLCTIANFWAESTTQQELVIQRMHEIVPRPSADAQILLDGVCNDYGPAPVFSGHRDFKGAIIISYDLPSLHGNVITRELQVTPGGVSIGTFRTTSTYEYGSRLYVFNAHEGSFIALTSFPVASSYFAAHRPQVGCLAWRGWFEEPDLIGSASSDSG